MLNICFRNVKCKHIKRQTRKLEDDVKAKLHSLPSGLNIEYGNLHTSVSLSFVSYIWYSLYKRADMPQSLPITEPQAFSSQTLT
jgi:hypothetical protein